LPSLLRYKQAVCKPAWGCSSSNFNAYYHSVHKKILPPEWTLMKFNTAVINKPLSNCGSKPDNLMIQNC
jgi:hypothetical protein